MITIPTEKSSPLHYKAGEVAAIEREIPPYNGWGSEEDSRANCIKLIAQAPKRDFSKFMQKDRYVCILSLPLPCNDNVTQK